MDDGMSKLSLADLLALMSDDPVLRDRITLLVQDRQREVREEKVRVAGLRLQIKIGRNMTERVQAFLSLPENVGKKFDACQIRHGLNEKGSAMDYALSSLVTGLSTLACAGAIQGFGKSGYYVDSAVVPCDLYVAAAEVLEK